MKVTECDTLQFDGKKININHEEERKKLRTKIPTKNKENSTILLTVSCLKLLII